MVCSARRFVVYLALCCFVLVFFGPFGIAVTSLGEERTNLSAFRTFDRFVLVWICRFPLPLGVWEGLRFVIVALPGLFSYLFLSVSSSSWCLGRVAVCDCGTPWTFLFPFFFFFFFFFFSIVGPDRSSVIYSDFDISKTDAKTFNTLRLEKSLE